MPGKKILMFFKTKKDFTDDPFFDQGEKRSVYYDFFQKGTARGYQMYLAYGISKYLGGTAFSNPMLFDGEKFVVKKDVIEMDAVLDLSMGLDFPPAGMEDKVLNNRDFKLICWDKNLTYGILKDYMPLSVSICDQQDFRRKITDFSFASKVVLKPAKGIDRQDIVVDFPENIIQTPLQAGQTYILQSFVDTSSGAEGLVPTSHDIRVTVVNGNILAAQIRKPKINNFAKDIMGETEIEELPLDKIPSYIMYTVNLVKDILDEDFNRPMYNIDLGVEEKKAYVFEINYAIDFPAPSEAWAKAFVESLLDRLGQIAEG